jgi:hypothetical protein
MCSLLTKGDAGDAFGLVRVWDDAIEIRSPTVDDLLPFETRRGVPTGRPAADPCDENADAEYTDGCESVTLHLRASARRSEPAAVH